MSYLGDFALGSTFDTKFTTVNTSGVPTTLAGTPVVSAYPDNSLTELIAGITLTVDFDARTGLHNIRVVATGANGYAAASNYHLVITTGTVGGSSVVGYVVGEFSIEARSALRPTTSGRTLDVSAAGEAGLDWANIGSPTTAQNLSATNIDVDQVVASVSGAVGSVTGAVGSVTGSVGSVAAGGIASTAFAAGAINAAAIATDAIGAAELAADAVAEIADQVWDEARAGHVAVGSFGEGVATVQGTVASLGGGAISAGAFQAGAIDNAAFNVTETLTANPAAGGITAASFAAGAIDAAAIATDAIGSAEFSQAAADKVFGTGGATLGELAQAAPSATPRPDQALMLLYMALRNKIDVDATFKEVHNDAGTVICKKALTDAAGVYSEAEMVTGP